MTAVLAATTIASADSVDPSPAGWQRTASQGVTYYRRQGLELRLWAPEPVRGALGDWFSKRIRTLPGGVTASGLEQKSLPAGLFVAAGKARIEGQAGMLADIACAAKDGRARYGELLVRSLDKAAIESGIRVVVEACGLDPGAPTQNDKPEDKPKPGDNQMMSSGAVALASKIEAVGFRNSFELGVGGYMYPKPTPVVLFKDGTTLDDIAELAKLGPDNLDDHHRAHPRDWSRWRKGGKGIEVEACKKAKPPCSAGKQWESLAYKTAYGPLPKGARIAGRYKSMFGGGNVAYGGDVMIAGSREMTFNADGTFTTSKSVGASSDHFATSNQSGSTSGRYDIDGFVLTLKFGNGQTAQRTIVAEGQGKPDALWLDGIAYTH